MKSLKFLSLLMTIAATLCCLVLMWNESATTCGLTTCKVFETMFLIVSLGCFGLYKDTKLQQ